LHIPAKYYIQNPLYRDLLCVFFKLTIENIADFGFKLSHVRFQKCAIQSVFEVSDKIMFSLDFSSSLGTWHVHGMI